MNWSQISAQHFLSLGIGYSGIHVDSEDLDRFKSSYNSVNQLSLSGPLKGLNDAFGISGSGGYCFLGRYHRAFLVGFQRTVKKASAQYGNGDIRNLELEITHGFIEAQYGRNWNGFFLDGVAKVFFSRHIVLKSRYILPGNRIVEKSLSGDYRGKQQYSLDLGIAMGLYRKPIFLEGKITLPVYIRSQSGVLVNTTPQKVQDNTHRFPDDYYAYTTGSAYSGISDKIDGVKISITVYFAWKFRE